MTQTPVRQPSSSAALTMTSVTRTVGGSVCLLRRSITIFDQRRDGFVAAACERACIQIVTDHCARGQLLTVCQDSLSGQSSKVASQDSTIAFDFTDRDLAARSVVGEGSRSEVRAIPRGDAHPASPPGGST